MHGFIGHSHDPFPLEEAKVAFNQSVDWMEEFIDS